MRRYLIIFLPFKKGESSFVTLLSLFLPCVSNLLHLMYAIAHASTCTTSLMHVKNSMIHVCLWHLLSGTLLGMKKMKQSKSIKLNNWSFSLIFVTFLFAWILYFHVLCVWLKNKGKILSFEWIYSRVSYSHSSAIIYNKLKWEGMQWRNGLVVKVLDSQSRGPMFKTSW